MLDAVTFSRIDPEGKLVMGFRKASSSSSEQDSLGGNNRTVMIACISPTDINAEETLNTLKFANHARNIHNKPIVNRNPMSNEMLRMRQQLEFLKAELLCAHGGGILSDKVQVLKVKISWLEANNEDLCRELLEYRNQNNQSDLCETECSKSSNMLCETRRTKKGPTEYRHI